jgi:hypothetical protein
MGRKKAISSSDTFLDSVPNLKEPNLTKGTIIKNKFDLQAALRKHFYKSFTIYEAIGSSTYIVIFHAKWYEWLFRHKIKKFMRSIIYKIPSTVFIEFTICYALKE